MIVIPTADRNRYLDVLGKCDKITGTIPYNGAHATVEQIQPFVDYIKYFVEKKLNLIIPFAR
ncbi:MAG: Fic family protein, partial [Dysgonamonadaceae bacterium]|nr:Fic family protein [Dysgonamonadaceae bacterium]